MREPSLQASNEGYELLSDRPFDEVGDPLGFDHLAKRLKNLILSSRRSTPFTIGIEASWGAGKSSLMRQLERELRAVSSDQPKRRLFGRPGGRANADIRTVWFNAWTADKANVQEGLVKSVLQAFDARILARALRKKRMLTAIRIVTVGFAGFFRLTPLVDAAWQRLSFDARTRNEISGLVSKAMQDWLDRPLQEPSGREPASTTRLVVVFVDDLDRCSAENVARVFEAVKLYLDAPGLVFILGYDPQRIQVGDVSVPAAVVANGDSGDEYLDKIVQIVFRIPPLDEEMATRVIPPYLMDGTTQPVLFDGTSVSLIVKHNGRNPRRIKRFVNRFILDYQLNFTVSELQPELLVKALIFEAYFPAFARMLADDRSPNPIEAFLAYAGARAHARRGGAASEIADYLASVGAPVAGSADQALDHVEQQELVPQLFVNLVRNKDFVSLTESLREPEDQHRLARLIERRRRERLDLDGADLRGRSFVGADLSRASLVGANLGGVSAERVILERADLSGANLSAADLRSADLTSASFVGANLRQADLQTARLESADLTGASLDEANLRQADCQHAEMSGTSLQNANLEGASFDGASLMGANLSGARWDVWTTWPADYVPPVDPSTLDGIDGLDDYDRRRLERVGVATIEQLAQADPAVLAEAASLPTSRARDWVDQAVLKVHVSEVGEGDQLRAYGIRTATDFLAIFGPEGVANAKASDDPRLNSLKSRFSTVSTALLNDPAVRQLLDLSPSP